MALLIPIPPDLNAFSQRVSLDDEYFVLSFRWNDRAERWYMDIDDANDVRVASGILIAVDTPLTAHLASREGMPRGTFVAVDGTDSGIDPGYDELGQRVHMVYLEEADLA